MALTGYYVARIELPNAAGTAIALLPTTSPESLDFAHTNPRVHNHAVSELREHLDCRDDHQYFYVVRLNIFRRFRITAMETAEVPQALQHTWSGHARTQCRNAIKSCFGSVSGGAWNGHGRCRRDDDREIHPFGHRADVAANPAIPESDLASD